jgi:hypothetical protein
MKEYIFAGLLILPPIVPVLASSFYVALDNTSNQCRIMVTKPDGKIMRMLGDHPYASYTEAQEAIKTMPECTAIPGTPLDAIPKDEDE